MEKNDALNADNPTKTPEEWKDGRAVFWTFQGCCIGIHPDTPPRYWSEHFFEWIYLTKMKEGKRDLELEEQLSKLGFA